MERIRQRLLKAAPALLLAFLLGVCGLVQPALADSNQAGVTINITGRSTVQIVFVNTPDPIQPDTVSGPITIEVRYSRGTPVILSQPVTISLASTSASGHFLSGSSGPDITSIVIPAGSSRATFYYTDAVPGMPMMTASETPGLGWLAGRQVIVVTTPPAPEPPAPPPPPPPPPKPVPVEVGGGTTGAAASTQIAIRQDGTVTKGGTVTNEQKTVEISIPDGVKISILPQPGVPAGQATVANLNAIEVIPVASTDTPVADKPAPAGYIRLSPIYEVRALVNNVPTPVSFDRPISLVFEWDTARYPNAIDRFVAYYSDDVGWVATGIPPGFVAEVGHEAGETTHFTPFAVFGRLAPAPPPAVFNVRDLSINPKQVKAGESVTITATIANIGGMRGEYVLRLSVPGVLDTYQTLNLAPRESQQVRFTIVPTSGGNYPVQLGDLGDFFTVTAAPAPLPIQIFTFDWWVYLLLAVITSTVFYGIAFMVLEIRRRRQPTAVVRRETAEAACLLRITGLRIVPKTTRPGTPLTVTAEVTNIGLSQCAYTIVLKVSGIVEALKDVSLRPNQRERVAFTVMKNAPGGYEVDIEGLKARFTVLEA
ncbi:MAG: CARDB domain-containing protein [Chloroflexota bacterium]